MVAEKKPIMSSERKRIFRMLNKGKHLACGFSDRGAMEYFFTDGTYASAFVIEGMLRCGLLRHEVEIAGMVSQNIVRA